MNACRDLEQLLSLRAVGALEPEEAARVETHLVGCASCRAEADATAEALALAKLPAPSESEDERRARGDLPGRVLDELHRAERRRGLARRILAGVAVAAAASAFVLAPAILRKDPAPPPAAAVAAEATWQEPDLDRIWEDTQVLEWEQSTALAGGYDTETATLAALEW